MRLRDIHPRKGTVLRKWGPKQARAINLLVKRGLADWQSEPDTWPSRGRFHHWHFGGLRVTLTRKGQMIARKRLRHA